MIEMTILIGNSDDKLTQQQWSKFVHAVAAAVWYGGVEYHGTSEGSQSWQNACWVVHTGNPLQLKKDLRGIARDFEQDSIAIIEGTTEFLEGPK